MMNTDLLKRLKPLYGSLVDALWLEYQVGDDTTRREVESLIALLAYGQLGLGVGEERLLLEPPARDVIGGGDYHFGDVIYPGIPAYPFCVRRNELLRHVFILGPSGTGKSTLLLGLLEQLLRDGLPFMVFDFKRNYRCLLHAPNSGTLVVFTVGRNIAPLQFNALRAPPGVQFSEWAEALADICGAAYLLLQGARNVLKEALVRAHQEHAAAATLRHAYELVGSELQKCRSGSRRYGWLESTSRTLQELSDGPFGDALNQTNGPELDWLLARPVVMELEGLGEDQKRFFCLLMLQGVLLLRKHGDAAREQLQHALIFDESHNVFPKDQYGELGVPSRLAREVREYGEAVVAATQQSDVADSLIANSGIKIFLRCDFPRDVDLASKLLQIDAKWLPKLPIGFGIARLAVRHYTPFLFHFNEEPIKNQHVTDDAVQARWQQIGLKAPLQNSTITELVTLSEQEEALLRDIAEHPISNITARYQRLAWNAYTGNKTKDSVIQKGLAFFDPVSTPTGRVKILSLTPTGNAHLPEPTRKRYREGSVAHEYWRHELRTLLEKHNYVVEEEYNIGKSQTTDLHATKDSNELFIEIETGKSDIAHNIEKCQQLYGRVFFFFVEPSLVARYAPLLKEQSHIVAMSPAEMDRFVAALGDDAGELR